MNRLFNLQPDASKPIMLPAGWNTVRRGLETNLRKIVGFYRNNVMSVQSNHFLVKLIQSIVIPLNLPPDRYYDNVDNIAMNLSMALGMTSTIFNGRIHRNVFYGNDSPEIIVASNESFDPFMAAAHWENLAPVRVLRHPVSDLNCALPTGKPSTPEYGFATIVVNIPMLALMWRCFFLEQLKNKVKVDRDGTLGEQHFVHMYVLPNMLYSHFDYALFNRYLNYSIGKPLPKATRKHSFSIPDYTSHLDPVIETVLENLKTSKRDFTGVLRNVPTILDRTMDDVMGLPDVAQTRQIVWAMYLTRVPALEFMLDASGQEHGSRNQVQLNMVKRIATNLHSNSVLRSVLDQDSFYDAMIEVDDLKTSIG